MEREQDGWRAERVELLRQKAELERRLAYQDIDRGQRETQRDQIRSLEGQRGLLSEANRQARAEIENLISRSEAKSPFPALAAASSRSRPSCPRG